MLRFCGLVLVFVSVMGSSQSSLLSRGQLFKIGVFENGVYRLEYDDLSALGLSASNIDPRQLQLLGSGRKGMLPQANDEGRLTDVVEHAIFVSGEADGSFDKQDYILFYGLGPHLEEWTQEGFRWEKNIYSDTSFYFLRTGVENGLRIQTKPSVEVSPDEIIRTFDNHVVWEIDEDNIISSGRQWFFDALTNGESHEFSVDLPGVNSDITLSSRWAHRASEISTFTVFANGSNLGALEIAAVPETEYGIRARATEEQLTIPQTQSLDLEVRYNTSTTSFGYLDYLILTFRNNLNYEQGALHFRVMDVAFQNARYEISGTTPDLRLWDVTDPLEVQSQSYDLEGGTTVFTSYSEGVEEYVLFDESEASRVPALIGRISNQDIQATTAIEGLIITHPKFYQEAVRLADFRAEHDGLNVHVVTIQQVYNAFSGGKKDVTAIRDYVRFIYEQGGTLNYLLLFGDCSYDYKRRITNNVDYIPIYESRESFHPVDSYSSDDYYGFLEENEGDWIENDAGNHTLDIGVGRIPANTIDEATTAVDKIIHYATSENTLGDWKHEIVYVADDGDGGLHMRQSERLSAFVDTTFSQYQINKLYLDIYEQVETAVKEVSPEATATFETLIEEGAFLIDYLGHGNELLWTDEEVLSKADINGFKNYNRLPVFLTATCEFGRYDNPLLVSGAEELLFSENGGGIALLTTTRLVESGNNEVLNQAFHRYFFDDKRQRLGDIIRETKNSALTDVGNRNFSLLGDPMLRPKFPTLEIEIDELENGTDTLKAFELVSYTGRVMNGEGFNGRLIATITDVETDLVTEGGADNEPFTYAVRNNFLFKGEVTVTNGVFELEFKVPKNITYQYGRGNLSLYAWDEETLIDAEGTYRNIRIGGSDGIPEDLSPPQIAMYLNTESFRNGDLVGDSPILIVRIEDESGITLSNTGIVNGLTLQLNESEFNLNSYYVADLDTYQSGVVTFPLQNLNPGSYKASITAWDANNNPATSSIEFEVSDQPRISVYNFANYPNPSNGRVNFAFEHDREEENLKVTLRVYNSRGELLTDKDYYFENSDRIILFPWDAETDSFKKLNQGIYFYRLEIKSLFDNVIKEISGRLVIN